MPEEPPQAKVIGRIGDSAARPGGAPIILDVMLPVPQPLKVRVTLDVSPGLWWLLIAAVVAAIWLRAA